MPARVGKVLVAEDDKQIGELCEHYLTRCGFEVTLAADGQEAYDKATAVPHDIILLDVLMPGMTGLEVCQSLKARHSTQHIPIVLMTGMDRPDDIVAGLQAGADEYVCKPIRLPELKVRLDNLLRRKRMFDLLQAHNDELVETLGNQSRAITELFTLSLQMNKSQHLSDLLDVLTHSLSRILGCRRVSVMLPDRDRRALRIASSVGIPRTVADGIEIPLSARVAQKAFEHVQPVVASAAETWAQTLGCSRELNLEPTPIAIAPLLFGQEPVGIITLTDRLQSPQEPFDPTDITVLTYVAQVAAIAIKNRLRQTQIRETQDVTIFALARLAESRDAMTGNHLRRVQSYCRKLAQYLRNSERLGAYVTEMFIDELWRAAPMHDIGKVGISDNILLKPGRLTIAERKIMERHTIIGGETLEEAEKMLHHDSFLSMAKEICYCHHERWDGAGYPYGLIGDAIPLSARILAVADVYDALTSPRPYKPAFSHEKSYQLIVEGQGSHFDPEICAAFVALAEEFNKIRKELHDEPDQTTHPSDDLAP